MSAGANLSSDDMRAECMLERFEQERFANTWSDPMLRRIAGERSDEQFLEVAGLDKPAKRKANQRPAEIGQSLVTSWRSSANLRRWPQQAAWA